MVREKDKKEDNDDNADLNNIKEDDDDNADYKEIFKDLKKYFKINSNLFDIDFFVFPDNFNNKNDNDSLKGFKVSYHFDSGKDKPEVKIEGNFDEEKIKDYIKNINLRVPPNFKRLPQPKSRSNKEIDAAKLYLAPCTADEELCAVDPFTEINDLDDFIEVLLEVPGIEKGDVKLNLSENGKEITFYAENGKRKYLKQIRLPFQSLVDNVNLEVNNGIAVLKAKKKEK